MTKRYLLPLAMSVSLASVAFASSDVTDEFEAFKQQSQKEYEAFKQQATEEFEQFRRQANEEFANFMSRPWTPLELRPAEKTPVRPSPDPVFVSPSEDAQLENNKPEPIVIREVVDLPEPDPQPQPVEPIREIIASAPNLETTPSALVGEMPIQDITPLPINPIMMPADNKVLVLNFYGREARFRTSDYKGLTVRGNTGKDFAEGWKQLNTDGTNNLILDCLAERENLQLCDWAYLQLIDNLAKKLSKSPNEKTLLTGFIFCQSGYKMRFGRSKDGMLHLFYAPTGIVYNTPRLYLNGDFYYLYGNSSNQSGGFEVCDFSFPKEQNLSFAINNIPKFGYKSSAVRNVNAKYHPDVKTNVAVNQYLIDFYNTYPDATLTKDPNSKWAIHGNTPVSPQLKEYLYPTLESAIKGKDQRTAANILINFAESFPYGYDDEIWGWDRAFFPDESWFYPKSDCEDHAIHFSRLVRDLIGLDVVLVVYDDHLATAVAFTEDVPGDYLMYKGKRYTICDPTIFYAGVGHTMQGEDNQSAVLIELK